MLERRGVLVVAGLPFAVKVASVVFVPLRSVVVVGAAVRSVVFCVLASLLLP